MDGGTSDGQFEKFRRVDGVIQTDGLGFPLFDRAKDQPRDNNGPESKPQAQPVPTPSLVKTSQEQYAAAQTKKSGKSIGGGGSTGKTRPTALNIPTLSSTSSTNVGDSQLNIPT
jgi:hypothetical protein